MFYGAIFVSALFAPVLFSAGLSGVLVAMPLWGIGYAVQDTLLKSLIAGIMPSGKRSIAFGLFYAGYGCGWLVGSIAAGFLYQYSRAELTLFASVVQLLSIPLFIFGAYRGRQAAASRGGA